MKPDFLKNKSVTQTSKDREEITILSFHRWNDSSMELKFKKKMSHFKSIILTGTVRRLRLQSVQDKI